MEIDHVDKNKGIVVFDDGSYINHEDFMKRLNRFFQCRIAGETLLPGDMERFMRRTSSKNLALLMKGKKMEGYLEGSQGKTLTPGQKIAIGAVVTLVFVGLIVFIALKNQGVF